MEAAGLNHGQSIYRQCVVAGLAVGFRVSSSAATAKLANHRADSSGSLSGVLVFPDPQDGPARFAKALISGSVSLPVVFELGTPPNLVLLRPVPVLRTGVPEASIDEHSELDGSENKIRSAPKAFEGCPIDPVAHPKRMHCSSELQLGSRVTAPLRLHLASNRSGARERRGNCRIVCDAIRAARPSVVP